MRLTVSSNGGIARLLQSRIDKWAAQKSICAKIVTPPELQWIWWQEYGVSGHGIDPVEAKLLAFPQNGSTELRSHVDWPGIRAHHTMGKAIDTVEMEVREHIVQALAEGIDNPGLVQEAAVESAQAVKDAIVEQMSVDLPGTRPDNAEYPKQSGKLRGSTAAEVFDELAVITGE